MAGAPSAAPKPCKQRQKCSLSFGESGKNPAVLSSLSIYFLLFNDNVSETKSSSSPNFTAIFSSSRYTKQNLVLPSERESYHVGNELQASCMRETLFQN